MLQVKNSQLFSFEKQKLKGVILINPFLAYDKRGYFLKDFSCCEFEKQDININLKEIFYAKSYKGVIRGLHFQNTKEQCKIVRCISGKIYDVVVDIRRNSPTFGQYQGFYLSEDNNQELLIPKGFAHGYLTLEDAIVSYKCDEVFCSDLDDGIMYNDVDLNIKWPLHLVKKVILSDKDKNLQSFKELKEKFNIN